MFKRQYNEKRSKRQLIKYLKNTNYTQNGNVFKFDLLKVEITDKKVSIYNLGLKDTVNYYISYYHYTKDGKVGEYMCIENQKYFKDVILKCIAFYRHETLETIKERELSVLRHRLIVYEREMKYAKNEFDYELNKRLVENIENDIQRIIKN